jgi:hypothetical protein
MPRRGTMKQLPFVVALGGWVLSTAACGDVATNTITSPGSSRCELTATANPATFPAEGGQGSVTVSADRECPWTADAIAGWIAVGTPKQGQGAGRVSYSVARNGSREERRGVIDVGGVHIVLRQAAPPPLPAAPEPVPTPQPNPAPAPNPGPAPNPPPGPGLPPAPNPAPAPNPPPAPGPTEPAPNPPGPGSIEVVDGFQASGVRTP